MGGREEEGVKKSEGESLPTEAAAFLPLRATELEKEAKAEERGEILTGSEEGDERTPSRTLG